MDIETIKELLKERNMTFADLAEKIGKERSVVYKTIQNGNPSLSFLLKLSEALGMTIDEIVTSPRNEIAHHISGFVEIDGVVHKVCCGEDLAELCRMIFA